MGLPGEGLVRGAAGQLAARLEGGAAPERVDAGSAVRRGQTCAGRREAAGAGQDERRGLHGHDDHLKEAGE